MSWRGRRVTDPKPVVHTAPGNHGNTCSQVPGLDPLFKGMEHAKSQLRSIEQRMSEAERAADPLMAGIDGSRSVPVDHIPTFALGQPAKPSSILVDSSGKTQYLRSREDARKVSRKDDKYKESEKERRQRSPLREPNFNPPPERRTVRVESGTASSMTTTGYKSATGSTLSGLATLQQTGPGGTLDERSSSSRSAALRDLAAKYHMNLTETQVPTDTEIRYLNDDEDRVLTQRGGVKGYMDLPGRWTKVDIDIPMSSAVPVGVTRQQEVKRKVASSMANTYPPKSAVVDGPSVVGMASSGSSGGSGYQQVNATYTINGATSASTSPNPSRRRPHRGLRDIENSSDTLTKLREKVRQQKLLASSGESAVSQGSSDSDQHVKHAPDDPVVSRGVGVGNPLQSQQTGAVAMVRKVATGPPVPRYQGFSEAEMKYKLPDGKMVKVSDIRRRKMKKMLKEGPLKDRDTRESQNEKDDIKKPVKVSRVVAPSHKPLKSDKANDIITTRSWRAGAKLVLQELGPNKVPHLRVNPRGKETTQTEEREKPENMPEKVSQGSTLSKEARAVLEELQSGSDDDHEGQDSDEVRQKEAEKKAMKRKMQKPMTLEQDTDEKTAKVRHYDSEEVRRYIARQKAERKKQQQQDLERERQAREQRQAQLSVLYKKQRNTTKVALPGHMEPKDRSRMQLLLQKQDEENLKLSGGSDKENRGLGGPSGGSGAWSDLSSTDSSVSGGSAAPGNILRQNGEMRKDESKPGAASSSRAAQVDSLINKYTEGGATGPIAGLRSGDSGIGATSSDIHKYLNNTGVQVDDIIARYSQRAAAIGSNFNTIPREPASGMAAASLPGRLRDTAPPVGAMPHQPLASTFTGNTGRSREERIMSLCQNASLLRRRVTSEAQRITTMAQSGGDRWALPREDAPVDGFTSRYDRITGNREQPNVYDTGLPGVGSMSKHLTDISKGPNVAAAAYQGSSGRQAVSSNRQFHHMKDTDELSDISDGTLHEDELYKPFPSTMPPEKVKLPNTSVKPAMKEQRLPASVPLKWAEPRGDPYSVLNVLSRRKDHLDGKSSRRPGLFEDVDTEEAHNSDGDNTLKSDHQLSDLLSDTHDSTLTEDSPRANTKPESVSQRSVSQQSRSPVTVSELSQSASNMDYLQSDRSKSYDPRSHQSASYRSASHHSATHHSASRRSAASQRAEGASRPSASLRSAKGRDITTSTEDEVSFEKRDEEADGDDTLNGTLTASITSENDGKLENDVSVDISEVSETSDLSVADRSPGNRRAYAPGGISYRTGMVSGRLSPGALERRMTAELNLLESMEESVRQLTTVDRSRGISLAQQETVSLAQILKAQQQGHAQEVSAYQRDTSHMSRELVNAHRTAAAAAENATSALERTRAETTKGLQESTMNLIQTQAEAARATAEAARQLSEVRMAAAGAASSIQEENTSRLVKDTAVATATAVTAALQQSLHLRKQPEKYLEQGTQYSQRGGDMSRGDTSTSFGSDTYESDYTRTVTRTQTETQTKSAAGPRSESRMSYTMEVETASPGTLSAAATVSIKTASIVTASDATAASKQSPSSIATESGAFVPVSPQSKSGSIPEVISDKAMDDYSIDFDTSVTEEEMEKSLREVVPSVGHRKKLKRSSSHSDLSSVASDDHPAGASSPSSRRLSFDGDSYTRFTVNMVRQYMREEEIRAQHQAALLKLRQRALKEKTQAELAWLEQQKHRMRNKGADTSYPLINKKRRGLLLRLQQEQAEIRRLQEASKAASKEREFILLQSQEIKRLRQSTQQILRKTESPHSRRIEEWLNNLDPHSSTSVELDSHTLSTQVKEKMKKVPGTTPGGATDSREVATEDELSLHLDESEVSSPTTPKLDLGLEPEQVPDTSGKGAKPDAKTLAKLRRMKLDDNAAVGATSLQKLKKMKKDDKFLTQREQQLLQRRLQVEGLLEWKQKLDREEAEIEAMEKQALALARRKEKEARDKDTSTVQAAGQSAESKKKKETEIKEKEAPVTVRTPRVDVSELDSIKEETYSDNFSISRTKSGSVIRTRRTQQTDSEIPEEVPDTARTGVSQTTSIGEEIANGQTTTSVAEEIPSTQTGKRTPDSSDEANVQSSATNEDYTNETFESEAGTTTQTVTQTAPASNAVSAAKKGAAASVRPLSLRAKVPAELKMAPKSPKSPFASPTRRGSESESEDSFSMAHSETASDQSDVEGRIRALSEDLKRRKMEAERLKKEQKKRHRDKLRQQEQTLKNQIEAYDSYISQVRTEMVDSVEMQERNAVQPQIKKPTPGPRKSPLTLPKSPTDNGHQRTDSDGSRSTSSMENGLDTVTSPSQTSPISPFAIVGRDDSVQAKANSMAESMSESIISPQGSTLPSAKKTSTPEDRPSLQTQTKWSKVEDDVPEEVSMVTDMEEGDDSVSGVKLRLDVSQVDEAVAESSKVGVPESQPAVSARSGKSMTEDIVSETRESPRPESVSHKDSSAARPKEAQPLSARSERSIKSQYSSEVDDESDKSVSHKSEKSFTYSTSRGSKSELSYSDEFSESTATDRDHSTKSSPRRKDRPSSTQSKKSHEKSQKTLDESIRTEEEVSEQLDIESNDEDEEVLLKIDEIPLDKPEPVERPQTPEPVEVMDALSRLQVGDRVLVGGMQPGILRFKGKVEFAPGFFGGVELDKPEGTSDGSKEEVQYFRCRQGYGLFAPPDKLDRLPEGWKEAVDHSGEESDVSEATLLDDDHSQISVDEAQLAILRRDVTKPDADAELKKPGHEDGEVSIPEDVSVATTVDSELDRVISSAAAAVEEFGVDELGRHSPEPRSVDTMASELSSPRPQGQNRNLNQVVDSITDGILHLVVQDSMQAVSQVSERQGLRSPEPQHVPNDNGAQPEPISTLTDQTSEEVSQEPSDKDQALDVATNKLLNESISQMLSIYKRKKTPVDEESTEVQSSDPQRSVKPVEATSSGETTEPFENVTNMPNLDDLSSDRLFDRPDTTTKDVLDQLYDELGALTGDTDEWFDDDFGLGLSPHQRAPPPYPGTPQEKKDKPEGGDLRLDLRKVTQEPFFAVPHKASEVQQLTTKAFDIFWEMRRYGESWDSDTSPPSSYFAPEDRGQDIESCNRRAYKHLLFDLTGEILMDIYKDEELDEDSAWVKPKHQRHKYYRGRDPPTTTDLVQPIVVNQVLKIVNLAETPRPDSKRTAKWSSRKKRDRVDNVLLQELVEEEPDWVDYNEDEVTVKMQITDAIFDSLLVETAQVFNSIAHRRGGQ